MLDQEEFLRLCDNPAMPRPPMVLYDYREVWDKPEMAGEPEGQRNAREIKRRNPAKFMERMAILEGQYLEACRAFAEAENTRMKAVSGTVTAASSPSEQIPDEGTQELIAVGEECLRSLGLEGPDDDAPEMASANRGGD